MDGDTARRWLALPLNPNGRSNTDVLFPWLNGEDVTARRSDKWIINFGERSENDASLYQAPFQHVLTKVKPQRTVGGSPSERRLWWLLARRAPNLFASLLPLRRFIATPETPTHTVFAWLPRAVVPDKNLVIFARDDDTSFGILSSRYHVSWARALGSPYGNHPTAKRYNSTRVFRTFPFPKGLTLDQPAAAYADDPRAIAIAAAARRLNELREAWLNPPDLVERVAEVVASYPDRIVPVNAQAAVVLKKRTLTNLYNERPAWLDNAHRELDAASEIALKRNRHGLHRNYPQGS